MKFVLYKSSVAMKKGNRLGSTELDHKIRPDFAASKLEEENKIKNIVKSKNKTVQKFFFKDITTQFIFSSSNLDILNFMQENKKYDNYFKSLKKSLKCYIIESTFRILSSRKEHIYEFTCESDSKYKKV